MGIALELRYNAVSILLLISIDTALQTADGFPIS